MPSQTELDHCYMQVALAHKALSKAVRKKVGACLVTNTGVIIPGYNGLASGGDNELEHVKASGELITKEEVIHAELNCILKAAKEGVSCLDSTLYVTLSPCLPCSEMLAQSGIKEVVFMEEYRDLSGIRNLLNKGIRVRGYDELI